MLSTDQKSSLAANAILPVLAIVAVSLRFLARRKKSLRLKADDFLILLALVQSFACAVSDVS